MFRKKPSTTNAGAAPTGPTEVIPPGVDAVVAANAFWRARYTSLLRVVLVQGLIILGLIALSIIIYMMRPEPRYFATDGKGYVIEIVPLRDPLLSGDALTQWAADTARMAYSLDFVNWREQVSRLEPRLSEAAYRQYLRELNASGNLALVRDDRVVIESVTEPPRIVKSGLGPDARFTWSVEVPMSVVTHYGGSNRRVQRLLVTMEIKRVDVRLRPESGVVATTMLARVG